MSTSEQVNILMVDDQPAKLLSYEAILANLGLRLIKATSGREALEQLLKQEIAVVLMDVSMPELDGFELASMIRQHPRYQETAIIFISAVHLTDLDRLKGYEVGAVDYIQVPVIPEILRAKVTVFAELFRKTRELEALNQDLERRVEQRTAALEVSMAREREARLAAEAAIQVRDDFLSVAAHELKTPLTGLRVTAQTLGRKLSKSDVSDADWLQSGLLTVDQQADRLSRLIEQLLDISRLDQNKLVIDRMATDLTALAERLIAVFQARTTKHTVVLTADSGLTAEVDPLGMERVLGNLLDNAIKYSPQGGQIDVELSRVGTSAGETEHARLVVRDRGLGIPPERRAAIFERFYQAHATDHRSGLGLGLYITRQIVELHGGSIVAEFPADGGTRFIVTIPGAVQVNTPVALSHLVRTRSEKPEEVDV
jgi:signal transduction histidine kinase